MTSLKKKWAAKDPKKFTHLLLDGGKLSVPDQQHSLFLSDYANAVARGEPLYVVETRTPVFRLFVDFDFKPPPPPDIITAAVQSTCSIAHYFFDATSQAVVLRKDVESDAKIGVHITWNDIRVDSTLAMAFRAHIVTALEAAAPEHDWKDIVDASVYSGSGLRLPWSSKVGVPGVYLPKHTCAHEGTVADIPLPTTAAEIRTWVKATSIRAPGAVVTRSCVVSHDSIAARSTATPQNVTHESVADHAAALAAFHDTLPAPYRDQAFTSMHRFGDFCMVLRSNSKKCGNKNHTEHTKNTVYFVILRKGYAYQRCYCRKDVVREGGVTCADYVSEAWPVSQEIVDALWPPVSEAANKLLDMLNRTRPSLKKRKF